MSAGSTGNMPTVSHQLVQLEICTQTSYQLVQWKDANSQLSTGENKNMPTVTGLSPRNLNGNCETIKTPKNNSFSHLENTEYPAYINNPFESRDHHRGTAGNFDYHLKRCFKTPNNYYFSHLNITYSQLRLIISLSHVIITKKFIVTLKPFKEVCKTPQNY